MDVWRGTLSLRKVGVLVTALPPESATKSALAPLVDEVDPPEGAVERRWSTDQHLLASIIDSISYLQWLTAAANAKTAPPKPAPIPRPGTRRTTSRLTVEQRNLIRQRNRGG